METENEQNQILQMISDGRISADYGAELLDALKGSEMIKCPYCAEAIVSTEVICPHCQSTLSSHYNALTHKRRFRELSTSAKMVIIYQLLACVLVILPASFLPDLSFSIFQSSLAGVTQDALAIIGIIGAIAMIVVNPVGWWLSLIWAGAQVVVIIVNYQSLFTQFLYLGGNVIVNGDGLGINLVGIVLVILLLVVRKDFYKKIEN